MGRAISPPNCSAASTKYMKKKASTMAASARRSPTNFIVGTIARRARAAAPVRANAGLLLRRRRELLLDDQSEMFVAGFLLLGREHDLDQQVVRRHSIRDDEQLGGRRLVGGRALRVLQLVQRREVVRQPRDLD